VPFRTDKSPAEQDKMTLKEIKKILMTFDATFSAWQAAKESREIRLDFLAYFVFLHT